MQPRFSSLVIYLMIGLFSACAGCGSDSAVDTLDVQIIATGGTSQIEAEVADSSAEREQGLMNRTSLADSAGMLFIWPNDVQNPFWMKNTTVSLDIFFVSADKLIVGIAKATTPNSTDLIVPESLYRYVLEVNAGFADSHGVAVGDRLLFDEN